MPRLKRRTEHIHQQLHVLILSDCIKRRVGPERPRAKRKTARKRRRKRKRRKRRRKTGESPPQQKTTARLNPTVPSGQWHA